MDKQSWTERIRQCCEEAGTYRPFFDSVIETLAGIMERRDNAEQKFLEAGGQTVVEHTNKAGATNIVKHPAMVVVMECDRDALAYWRDLGLTPMGLRKLNAEVVKADSQGGFERLLARLTDD